MKAGGTWTPGRPWTDHETAEARRLRASGLLWAAVGEQIGRSGSNCRQRITRILGEPDPLTGPLVRRPRRVEASMPDAAAPPPEVRGAKAEPLPAGSAISWGAITAGTLLEGRSYPCRP